MGVVGAFMVPHPPLIIPNIGKGQEKSVLETIESYHKVAKEIEELQPETIVISSPHAPLFRNGFYISHEDELYGSFKSFGAGDVSFREKVDKELVEEIVKICSENHIPTTYDADTILDHGTMVPLYFIRKYWKDCKIVVVGLSSLPLINHYQIGKYIKEAAERLNRRIIYVASGDLSHKLKEYGPYGFDENGVIYDKKMIDTCSNARFGELLEYDNTLLEKASECGHPSVTMMAGALDNYAVKTKLYSYQDITGVGYGICSFYPEKLDSSRCYEKEYLDNHLWIDSTDPYVFLAKRAIDFYILTGQTLRIPVDVTESMLNKKAGVFVSIHKFGQLRGCIGTIQATQGNICKEIILNAISAATMDARFDPITEDELDYLEIHVDELTLPEAISSIEELDPKKYGVIVTSGLKRGLLLPDLDGIDEVETQVQIAMRKGNISPNEEIHLQRFEVIRHK